MIKLVCCDIDNTLLHKNNPASGKGFPGVLDNTGILPMIATGRSVTDVARLFPDALKNAVIASYDGALVLFNGAKISDRPVDVNIVRAFADGFPGNLEARCDVIYYGATDCFTVGNNGGRAERRLAADDTMRGHLKKVASVAEIREPVYKISVFSENTSDFEYLAADWASYLNCVFRNGSWCEFVSAGTDKGFALGVVMEKFGVTRAEAMAFGDGVNDFSMLEAVDFSFAIEGSAADKEDVAEFVTSDVIRTIRNIALGLK